MNSADVFANWEKENEGKGEGEKTLDIQSMKPNMFDESCPDNLEFRSTINARVWFKVTICNYIKSYNLYENLFQLDKCVDGKLSCYGCNDEFDFDPLPGNTADPPIKLPHNPKPTPWGSSDNLKPDFLNKPPPKGTKPPRPDAPTLPPQARINVSLISNYLYLFVFPHSTNLQKNLHHRITQKHKCLV